MGISLTRAWRACTLLLLAVFCVVATATEFTEPRGELTLAQALESALRRNPELLASRYELTAAQARILQAGLKLNPELGLELENFAGTGALQGVEALETTLSLSQVIELGDKRGLRQSVAASDSDLITVELRARQLDTLAEVTRRFIDVVAAQERTHFAAENSRLAQQTLAAVTARAEAARAPVAEVSRARIGLTRAAIEERQAATDLRTARHALAFAWGSIEPGFSAAKADLFAFTPLQPFTELMAQVERNPDITRFASQARLREAELRLAQAQARPNLAFSLGVRRLEDSSDTALVAGFSMPLPLFDRNQGAIREARVRRVQTDAQLQAALVRARATLYAVYQEMTAARERAESLRNDAVPQAQTALEQTQSGYERGRFSFLELLTAQQELLALRAAAIDAAAGYHRLLVELERITSEPLTTNDLEAPLP
jgi:cobalt-zinc-cadmium efflux system outer membrane protein